MKLKIVKGDITKFKGDMLVNAANTSLTGSGGLTAAVFRAAGPGLAAECAKVPKDPVSGLRCDVGNVHETDGYALSVKRIVHVVGPKWEGGSKGEAEMLASIYERIVVHSVNMGWKSIAFPSLSTGHHGFPIALASQVAVFTIGRMLDHYPDLSVSVYVYSDSDYEQYGKVLKEAKALFADLPRWLFRVTGMWKGDGQMTADDKVVFECRNAGQIGKFTVDYWIDNFPYFGLRSKINGVPFEAGHKHSYMAWSGGIQGDVASVQRYIPAFVPFPVRINDVAAKPMTAKEILAVSSRAEKSFWVTDPRFLYAACSALCGEKKRMSAVLACNPTVVEARQALESYHLLTDPPTFGEWKGNVLDCYPWLERIAKVMKKYGKAFLEKALTT